jgi:hypothetical protein
VRGLAYPEGAFDESALAEELVFVGVGFGQGFFHF